MRVVSGTGPPRYVHRNYLKELGGSPPPWFVPVRGQMMVPVVAEDAWAEETVRARSARWTIAYRLGLQSGALVVKELRIFPTEREQHRRPGSWSAEVWGSAARCPRSGITTALIRRHGRPLAAIRAAIPHLENIRAMVREFFPDALGGERTGLVEDLPVKPQQGRRQPRVSAVELRRVAGAYRRAFRKDRRRPIQLAAKALRLPPTRVRDLVRLARKRGILPETDRGRASIG